MIGDSPSFGLAIVGTGRGRGQIGITCCPGRPNGPAPGAHATRLLERDVSTIARWGARAVITLLDDLELARLKVKTLPALLAAHGVAWHQVPLHSTPAPDPAFEQAWRALAPGLTAILWSGGRIAIHCKDGKTRAGLVAARLLVESGCETQDAINRVRAARQGALDNPEQEAYIRAQKFLRPTPGEAGALVREELVESDWESAAVEHIARRISAGG